MDASAIDRGWELGEAEDSTTAADAVTARFDGLDHGIVVVERDGRIALRSARARIAVDDVGTGCASLGALRAFPSEGIEIDRSFVSGEKAGRRSSAVVRAIAELGSTFGMTTVAEGVERPDRLRGVRADGRMSAQGYPIGRPLPADDIAGTSAPPVSAMPDAAPAHLESCA